MAVVVAHVPLPVLLADVEVALEPGDELIGVELVGEMTIARREQTPGVGVAAWAREIHAKRIPVVLRRNLETGIESGARTDNRRGKVRSRAGLLVVERAVEVDVVGQVIGSLEERIGTFLWGLDQVDRGVVVLVLRIDEAVVIARGRIACRRRRTRIQRQGAGAAGIADLVARGVGRTTPQGNNP